MISKEDKAKIGDFREVFRMTINPTNDEDINKVVDDLFKNVEYNYEEYKDEVPYVSVEQETYKYHILQPVEGKYSLLDFLLNRAISNVDVISINNDNHFLDKGLSIDKNRYEAYRSSYTDDFIKKQYQKSRMHETGHVLHAWDVKQDNIIHGNEDVDFQKRVQLFNELLGYKYSNILQMKTIKKIPQKIYGWRGNKVPFFQWKLDEASTEYFATKYSGLYEDEKDYGISYRCSTNERIVGFKTPNVFNAYAPGSCLMYHLENLVSKEAMFQSMFFSNERAIDEYVTRYSEYINKVFEGFKIELQDIEPKWNALSFENKFLLVLEKAATPTNTEGGGKFGEKAQEKFATYYEVINKIFAYTYMQEYIKGNISREKLIGILPRAYSIAPVTFDKTKNEWIESGVRKTYKAMFEELQRETEVKSKVTPSNISNVTSQTVQANPGEMAKRVQSVSKSFAESLKQNTHSNDDGEPSTRSGYRYAQVDTYNRKKGQGR